MCMCVCFEILTVSFLSAVSISLVVLIRIIKAPSLALRAKEAPSGGAVRPKQHGVSGR